MAFQSEATSILTQGDNGALSIYYLLFWDWKKKSYACRASWGEIKRRLMQLPNLLCNVTKIFFARSLRRLSFKFSAQNSAEKNSADVPIPNEIVINILIY